MKTIKPKTYRELVCYKRCISLKAHIPHITEQTMGDIYRFLVDSTDHVVEIADHAVRYLASNVVTKTVPINMLETSFSSIRLSALTFHILTPTTSGGFVSGSSGNNNNNNNNNNNG